jgi:hypothetical protein
MLGVAGALGVEVLGFGNWYDAQSWVSRQALALLFAETAFSM